MFEPKSIAMSIIMCLIKFYYTFRLVHKLDTSVFVESVYRHEVKLGWF